MSVVLIVKFLFSSSVQWGGAPPARPPAPANSMAPTSQPQQQPMMYGQNMSYGQYGAPQMQWGLQQPG